MSRMSKIFNFDFSLPLSGNLKMLHFYTNLIRIGYLVTELWAIYQGKNNIKQKNCFLANISKTVFATSDSFPLIISYSFKLSNLNTIVVIASMIFCMYTAYVEWSIHNQSCHWTFELKQRRPLKLQVRIVILLPCLKLALLTSLLTILALSQYIGWYGCVD